MQKTPPYFDRVLAEPPLYPSKNKTTIFGLLSKSNSKLVAGGVELDSTTLKSYLKVLSHFLIWFSYRGTIYYLSVVRMGIRPDLFWYFTGFATLMEPLVFYSYYLYLIPHLLEQKKVFSFVALSLSALLLLPLVSILYIHFLQANLTDLPLEFSQQVPFWSHYWGVSLHVLLFMGLASGARFTMDWFKNQRLRSKLERQNLLSEVALLKSQVNPHFLFNTLNNIYTLSYKQDRQAPEAILKLSELMRYMLYEAAGNKVSLEKEIEYIQNYISLQKLRLKDPLKVNFLIQGDYVEKQITPMLLIPFVENAFKHGVSLHSNSEIYFGLKVEMNILYFQSWNHIVSPQMINQGNNEKGIGYPNVKKRLELLYPNQHKLSIYTHEHKYHVELTIKL